MISVHIGRYKCSSVSQIACNVCNVQILPLGGYTALCPIALHVQVYLDNYCLRAMWQKRVSEGH